MSQISLPESIEKFLSQPNFLILSTLRKDGSIQMSVVWYKYMDGVIEISTTEERAKYKNIERNDRVACLIINLQNPYQYVQLQGTAKIEKKGGYELIDMLSEKYTGNTPYQGDVEHKQNRVRIIISLTRFTSQGF